MKKLFTFLFLCSFVVLAQGTNSKIHHNLELVLLNTPSNEFVNVYAVLSEQFPVDELNQQTYFLTRKEKQSEVVRLLKEFALPRQQNVIGFLEQEKSQNKVNNIRSLWALNTVVFSATPDVIYNLAENFEEISEIRYDAQYDYEMLRDITEPISAGDEPDNGDGLNLVPQPGLILINAPAVWAEGDSGQGILVGNLDDGCDWSHSDLVNNIFNNLGEDFDNDGHTLEWNGSAWVFDPGDVNGVDDDANGYIDDFIGWDFQSNDNNVYNSSSSHGTSTSGIVCGDGTGGTQTGVAPKAKILPMRPSGEAQYWLAEQYAIDMGVDVITSSLSYKWYFSPQPNYPMFRQMTDVELAAGVVHSNSTSNDGNNLGSAPIPFNISAPGNCPPSWIHPDQTLVGGVSSVTGVGNVNAGTDVIVSSSPYGPSTWEDIQVNHPGYPYTMPLAFQDYPYETQPGSIGLLKPDVSAPGNGTVSTVNGTGYGSFSGTSGATPHVGGTFALMLSVNPMLTPEDVSRIIQTTSVEKGTPGKDPRYGAGRIDAYEAYLQAASEIPVELTSFTAQADEKEVILSWVTETELNNSGFSIERKDAESQGWNEIAFVPGHGTTTERNSYTYNDNDVKMGVYNYRLKQTDFDGTFEYSDAILVEVFSPSDFRLEQNFPNPFNPNTVIEFSVPQDSRVTLQVYSSIGELVISLINKNLEAGYHRINFFGSNLPSGTYVYQLKAASENKTYVETKKMMLLK